MDRIERLIQNLKNYDENELPDIIQLLAVSGDTRTVDPLISIVQGAYLYVREKAAQALGKMGDPKAVPSLIYALETGYSRVREKAAEALGKIGDGGAMEALINALKDEHFGVREKAARALGQIGDYMAAEPLKKILADEYYGARQAALEALNNLGVPGISETQRTVQENKSSSKIEKLAKRLFNPLGWIRPRIVRALGETRDAKALEPLVLVLKKGGYRARENAVDALSKVGGAEAAEALVNHGLTDGNPFIREKAAEALLKIGTQAIAPLIKQLGDNDSVIAAQTVDLLVQIGEPVVTPLIQALKDNPDARTDAAKVLGDIGDTRAVEPLLQALTGELDVRIEAVKALGKLGDTRAVEQLISLVTSRETEEQIRVEAVKALGILRDPIAVKSLCRVLKDKAAAIQVEAAAALGNIGDRRAAEPLFNIIKKFSSDWRAIKRHSQAEKAVPALGKIGDTRAVEPLIYLEERFITEPEGNVSLQLQAKMPTEDRDFYCEKCFCRFCSHAPDSIAPVSTYFRHNAIHYYACRMCHSNLYLIEGIKTVVFVLDRRLTKKTIRTGKNGETLVVNGFKRKGLFDYDEIRIIDADDFDVEALVIKLRNDMDDQRRKRLAKIPVFLSPQLKLSPSKMNLLKDNFNIKIIRED